MQQKSRHQLDDGIFVAQPGGGKVEACPLHEGYLPLLHATSDFSPRQPLSSQHLDKGAQQISFGNNAYNLLLGIDHRQPPDVLF